MSLTKTVRCFDCGAQHQVTPAQLTPPGWQYLSILNKYRCNMCADRLSIVNVQRRASPTYESQPTYIGPSLLDIVNAETRAAQPPAEEPFRSGGGGDYAGGGADSSWDSSSSSGGSSSENS